MSIFKGILKYSVETTRFLHGILISGAFRDSTFKDEKHPTPRVLLLLVFFRQLMLIKIRLPASGILSFSLKFCTCPLSLHSSFTTAATMAPTTTTGNNAPKQPLKILMLHGYTQSGSVFYSKSRALIKNIQKALPLHQVDPVYPTAPIRLDPTDIPGFEPSSTTQEGGSGSSQQQELEAYGWWRHSSTPSNPPEYIGLNDGLNAVATVIRNEGPFDGIIGFSQGAALAAMVASLLEPGRKESFIHFSDPKVASVGFDIPDSNNLVPGIPFPESFEEAKLGSRQGPLKFAICYCGFRAPGPRYRAFYENPPIQTPVLHVLGSLDSVVDDSRSRALIQACAGNPQEERRVVHHPGGHFLPSQRAYLDAAIKFIREQLEGRKEGAKKEVEEDVNDMDVPF